MKLVKFCKQSNLPLIVGMDSNAHSSMWGSSDDNKRGEDLEELILEQNLHVMNQGTENTFSIGDKGSVIDVTLANEKALEMWDLNDWAVSKSESFSDHRYITFSGGKKLQDERLYRNLKKAN